MHRVNAWKTEEPSLELVNFKRMRNEVARYLEKRNAPPQELDLIAFADREKLMKQARIAGLSPRNLSFTNSSPLAE